MTFDDKFTIDSIAACLTALATATLAVGAWIQLPLVSKQVKDLATQLSLARAAESAAEARTREWETIRVCQKYDFDPVIEAACKAIWLTSQNGADYKAADARDMKCILNYLDGIAVGIKQDLYIEMIVKEQMESIFKGHVDNFILSKAVETDGYANLMELYGRWFQQAPASGYKRG